MNKVNLNKINKLTEKTEREIEAIKVLEELSKNQKDGILPGLDILPSKRLFCSSFGGPKRCVTAEEFYKYKL